MLNQCRDVRNNFSAAHPPIGALDEYEVLNFLSRCVRYALERQYALVGVDSAAFLRALKAGRFTSEQHSSWSDRLSRTHDAQRDLLLGTLHGIYCDPASSEETRRNALDVFRAFKDALTPAARSDILNRHSEYIAQGKEDRQAASQLFFQELGLLAFLTDSERHSMISHAARRLMSVHMEFNNFYNEPPFAERLAELTKQMAVPESAQIELARTVALCATGNAYGVSYGAVPHYHAMIRNFSPREVAALLEARDHYPSLKSRIQSYNSCAARYRELVQLIDPATVPVSHKALYANVLK